MKGFLLSAVDSGITMQMRAVMVFMDTWICQLGILFLCSNVRSVMIEQKNTVNRSSMRIFPLIRGSSLLLLWIEVKVRLLYAVVEQDNK